MLPTGSASWDHDSWETYCLMVLRLRHGDDLIRVPDKSGGDGGLEAFVRAGTAWQCYAPENEPLQPKARYALQRDKITADLKKLHTYQVRVQEILGPTMLSHWVLLTPKHESADVVGHCHQKASDTCALGLPFIAPDFQVDVQTLDDFPVEHAALQTSGVLPGDVTGTAALPELSPDGIPFAEVTGNLIDVMDGKLQRVISEDASRAFFRAELLKGKVAGDDLLARFDDRIPLVAEAIRTEISRAKRAMLLSQATGIVGSAHLNQVSSDIQERVQSAVPDMRVSNAELLAHAAITTWLQECSMNFATGDAT